MTYAEGGSGPVEPDFSQGGWRSAGVETAELTHEEVRGQFSDLLANELDESQVARINSHLSQCSPCARYLASLRRTVDLLRDLPGRTTPAPVRERLLKIPDELPVDGP